MTGQGASRNGGLRLTLQALAACGTAFARSSAALSRSCSSGSTGALLGAALLGRLQRYSCPAGLRQADGDGLLRRPGTVFTLTNVLDFLVNELACGCCRAFPGTKVCASLLYSGLLRHLESPPSANLGGLDPARCACSHVSGISFSSGFALVAVMAGLPSRPAGHAGLHPPPAGRQAPAPLARLGAAAHPDSCRPGRRIRGGTGAVRP
jgi:hypothetical protein